MKDQVCGRKGCGHAIALHPFDIFQRRGDCMAFTKGGPTVLCDCERFVSGEYVRDVADAFEDARR